MNTQTTLLDYDWEIVNVKIDHVFPNHGYDDHDPVQAVNKEEARKIIIGADSLEKAFWIKDPKYLNPYVKWNLREGTFELRIREHLSWHTKRTREEHLTWCKQRALEYVDKGKFRHALSSMLSDLGKHPGTTDLQEFCGVFGVTAYMSGDLQTNESMRKFIEGFN